MGTLVISRERSLSTPDLYSRIYIEADTKSEYRMLVEMFVKATCWRADNPDEADLVVFGGGADVGPMKYNATKHPSTQTDYLRDLRDEALYNECYEKGIPMLGICRGAQFGHVMNGGVLFQDVDAHHSSHSMTAVRDGQTFVTSSSHHQMVKVQPSMEVLAHSHGVSTKRFLDPLHSESGAQRDIEAFYYEQSGFFGVQGHPEYDGYPTFTAWTVKMVQQLFEHNEMYELRGNLRRLKKPLLEKRLAMKTLKELV
jgi:gamma-glutamyl-gamma-aminobutyrate hydrolase PuuD